MPTYLVFLPKTYYFFFFVLNYIITTWKIGILRCAGSAWYGVWVESKVGRALSRQISLPKRAER